MASQISLLDIQADSLCLVLHSPGKKPQFFRKILPADLLLQGRLSDPAGLAGQIRSLFRENRIPVRRCGLILPREMVTIRPEAGDSAEFAFVSGCGFTAAVRHSDLESLRSLLGQAGLSPVWAMPRQSAYQALIPPQESACLVVPEGTRLQAVFFHQGKFRMERSVDSVQALTQILQIYRFSNPDAPVSRIYLPRNLNGQMGGDWDILPLESLLPAGIPVEAAAAFGGLSETVAGVFPFKPNFRPKQWVAALMAALAILLFIYAGIYTPLQQRSQALAELANQEAIASQLASRLADYDALQEAYLRTGCGILTDSELALANRIDVLNLVEKVICPRASVTEFTLSGNSLTLHLREISLEDAGALVSALKAEPLIAQAQLHSAEDSDRETSSIFLRITLKEGNP